MLKWMLRWIAYMSKRITIEDLVNYVYIVRVYTSSRRITQLDH
jgi:hypothetical protein